MAAHLKLGDIKGESTAIEHEAWINFESISWPIHREVTDRKKGEGNTTLGDLVLVRTLDKSSPRLAHACASGTRFPDAELHLTTHTGQVYFTVRLHDVILTSYSFHGRASLDPLPSEEVTLSYTKVSWEYMIIDLKTGKPRSPVEATYDLNGSSNG